MQTSRNILTVVIAIIITSVVYSGILLKTNLDVVKSSKNSLLAQQISAQDLGKVLGNLQYHVNRYIIFRRQPSLDSIRMYEKEFQVQSYILYQVTRNVPALQKPGQVICLTFPEIMRQINNRLKKLPAKITPQNATEVYDDNSNPFLIIRTAIDQVHIYQIKAIKTSTNETIAAGSGSWKVSIFGSIFMLVVVLSGYIFIKKSYKRQILAEAKEKASEASQKEKEKLLQAIADNCTAIIFLKDKDFKYIFANKSFEQFVQLSSDDIIGKTQDAVFGEKYPEYVIGDEDRILRSGEIQESTQLLYLNDKKRYYLVTKFPLINEAGEIFGLGGIATDISEQREHENELLQAQELAEAGKLSQQRFLANMSHEIRTPMNGVIGMTNLLDSTDLNAEQEDYVNVIRQSSNILMLLINDILDVSKMQAGMLKLEKIPFEVREALKQIFQSYKPLADEMGIFLKCDVATDVPEFLLGDPLRLNQIISNLVNNAIKFTSCGGVSIKVRALEKETALFDLKIEVNDTGIGIPADKLEYVFNSFTQSSTSTTRKYGGTGLGLAIVKELVEMQNGTMLLSSELNKGSTFTVIIPFMLASVDKSRQPTRTKGQKFASLENKRILVVEDNLINQKVASQILLKAGFEVVNVADNGFKALDMLQTETYDAVLMDIQMPEIDGLETTRRIRNNLKLSVPVIALTASALPEDMEICFNAGMNDYITKPFLPEDLLQRLSQLLS